MQSRGKLLRQWRSDILSFAETCEMRRPDGIVGPPVFSERQRGWLSAIGATGDDGRALFRTVGIVAPKRSGKTLAAGVAMLHRSLGPDRLSVCLSNSRESAQSLSFSVASKILERHPLGETAEIGRNSIKFPWGSEIRVVPCSGKTVAGQGVNGLLVSDELWAADDWDPWYLLTSQAETGQVLMVSQASGRHSPVFELYELSEEGQPGLWFDYVEPEWCREHLSPNPFMTAEFLEQKRKELPAAVYLHYFENVWASGAETFLPPAVIESIFKHYPLPMNKLEVKSLLSKFGGINARWSFGIGVDRALPFSKTRERTAVATVAARPADEPEGEPVFVLLGCDLCETSSRPETLDAVNRAKSICPQPPQVHAETYQMADLGREIGAKLITPSSQVQQELFGRVARAANAGTLHLADEAAGGALRQELAEMECDTTARLVKWGHPTGGTDDTVYGLVHAMAAAEPATHQGGGGPAAMINTRRAERPWRT